MDPQGYVFEDVLESREQSRLRAIESIFDPATRRLLSATGDWSDRHCLEVGAGAGSIAAWMKSQVGATGRVVAVDLDVRFLDQSAAAFEVWRGDVREIALPAAAFDAVHARSTIPRQDLRGPPLGCGRSPR
jgi:predicted O-methyltransferase YrrM